MIVRIVKMTLEEDKVEGFITGFDAFKEKIRAQPGCQYLEVLRDKNHSGIVFTYSEWDSEEHLNDYRTTELFQSAWGIAKPHFTAKPEAWSCHKILELK
ncbi:MAG: antibiotic biosynthesis monooxygenase [Chitinophagales bacterium]|nr:antibiotic biosynthesis monooxygenase [Chitinophagales bacterium]